MTTIKAIETIYNGYRFRSRLEARWAVFFDVQGIQYEYEPEGFELDLGDWYMNPPEGVTISGKQKYLPDFWLPQVKMWAEVKAGWPTPDELALCVNLAEQTQFKVLVLDGPPNFKSYYAIDHQDFEHGGWDIDGDWYDMLDDNGYWKCESRFYCHGKEYITDWTTPIKPYEFSDNYGIRAVTSARQARFEHGENGRSTS